MYGLDTSLHNSPLLGLTNQDLKRIMSNTNTLIYAFDKDSFINNNEEHASDLALKIKGKSTCHYKMQH